MKNTTKSAFVSTIFALLLGSTACLAAEGWNDLGWQVKRIEPRIFVTSGGHYAFKLHTFGNLSSTLCGETNPWIVREAWNSPANSELALSSVKAMLVTLLAAQAANQYVKIYVDAPTSETCFINSVAICTNDNCSVGN